MRPCTSQPRVCSSPSVDPVRVGASAALPQLRLFEVDAVGDPLAEVGADLVGAGPPIWDGQSQFVVASLDADGVALEGGVVVPRSGGDGWCAGEGEAVADGDGVDGSFELLSGEVVGVALDGIGSHGEDRLTWP